jgi:hypothetical protein
LAIKRPKLALEWHPTKNGKLTPYDVSYSSAKSVWWECYKGHEWFSTVSDRNSGNNCPYCSNKKVCIDNCLATLNPKLVLEWHPTKNGKLTPYDVTCYSHKNVIWQCNNKHEWRSNISDRSSGNGCPMCNKVVLNNGIICDSIIEAYYYLKYKECQLNFLHNKLYGDIGKHRYDFYLIDYDKYIEVTSYNKNWTNWNKYKKTIDMKKEYVENKLRSQFQFIREDLNRKQINYVRNNMI